MYFNFDFLNFWIYFLKDLFGFFELWYDKVWLIYIYIYKGVCVEGIYDYKLIKFND